MVRMHTRDIVILCCFGLIFVTLGMAAIQAYYDRPYTDGVKAKRLKQMAYVTAALAYAVIAVAQLTKVTR